MIDWRQRIDEWIQHILGGGADRPSGLILDGLRPVHGLRPVLPSASLVPPLRLVPGRCTITAHRDWGLSSQPRVVSWSRLASVWRRSARRSEMSVYSRPVILDEGSTAPLDGQRVTVRSGGTTPRVVRVQDAPVLGWPFLPTVHGYEISVARWFWRDPSSWRHWTARVYLSTAPILASLPGPPWRGPDWPIDARIHYGVHKRAIKESWLQLLEDGAATVGHYHPKVRAAIESFAPLDPVWWSHRDLPALLH